MRGLVATAVIVAEVRSRQQFLLKEKRVRNLHNVLEANNPRFSDTLDWGICELVSSRILGN